jgi:hypothetical protein
VHFQPAADAAAAQTPRPATPRINAFEEFPAQVENYPASSPTPAGATIDLDKAMLARSTLEIIQKPAEV